MIQSEKIALFKKEDGTESADWIFAIRIIENSKSIDETYDFFKTNHVDIRPFFYPIYKHHHLSRMLDNDPVSNILNKEIVMIPSSPSITLEEQQHVVNVVSQFIFLHLSA